MIERKDELLQKVSIIGFMIEQRLGCPGPICAARFDEQDYWQFYAEFGEDDDWGMVYVTDRLLRAESSDFLASHAASIMLRGNK